MSVTVLSVSPLVNTQCMSVDTEYVYDDELEAMCSTVLPEMSTEIIRELTDEIMREIDPRESGKVPLGKLVEYVDKANLRQVRFNAVVFCNDGSWLERLRNLLGDVFDVRASMFTTGSEVGKLIMFCVSRLVTCLSVVSLIAESDPAHVASYTRSFSCPFFAIELFSVVYFALELILRLATAPYIHDVLLHPSTPIAVVSVIPPLLTSLTGAIGWSVGRWVSAFRILRVFRLCDVGTNNKAVALIAEAITAAFASFMWLCFMMVIAVLLFGTVFFYMETAGFSDAYFNETDVTWYREKNSRYRDAGLPLEVQSAREATWWSLVTLLSVGYGDVVPYSIGGKAVGGIVMLLSLLIVAQSMMIFIQKVRRVFDSTEEKELSAKRMHSLRTRLHRHRVASTVQPIRSHSQSLFQGRPSCTFEQHLALRSVKELRASRVEAVDIAKRLSAMTGLSG